jgi:hypothetical protein
MGSYGHFWRDAKHGAALSAALSVPYVSEMVYVMRPRVLRSRDSIVWEDLGVQQNEEARSGSLRASRK